MNKVKRFNEIYSDEDMEKGSDLDGTVLGINFKGDYRRIKLAIKKLVRLKYKIEGEDHKKEIDDIIDLLD